MKYNVMYNEADVDAAVEYLAKNNNQAKITKEYIGICILNNARRNAKAIIEDTEDGIVFMSTGGFMLQFTHESVTKRGYPIIEVSIYVYPQFGSFSSKTVKVRDK